MVPFKNQIDISYDIVKFMLPNILSNLTKKNVCSLEFTICARVILKMENNRENFERGCMRESMAQMQA